MRKVSESIIQGAIEALEFAQGKGNGSVILTPSVTTLPEPSESDSIIVERAEDGNNLFAFRKLDYKE